MTKLYPSLHTEKQITQDESDATIEWLLQSQAKAFFTLESCQKISKWWPQHDQMTNNYMQVDVHGQKAQLLSKYACMK